MHNNALEVINGNDGTLGSSCGTAPNRLGDINSSITFDRSSGSFMKTPESVIVNRSTLTFSFWIKKSGTVHSSFVSAFKASGG